MSRSRRKGYMLLYGWAVKQSHIYDKIPPPKWHFNEKSCRSWCCKINKYDRSKQKRLDQWEIDQWHDSSSH